MKCKNKAHDCWTRLCPCLDYKEGYTEEEQEIYQQARTDTIEEVRKIVMNHPFSFDAKIAMDVLLDQMKEQKHE